MIPRTLLALTVLAALVGGSWATLARADRDAKMYSDCGLHELSERPLLANNHTMLLDLQKVDDCRLAVQPKNKPPVQRAVMYLRAGHGSNSRIDTFPEVTVPLHADEIDFADGYSPWPLRLAAAGWVIALLGAALLGIGRRVPGWWVLAQAAALIAGAGAWAQAIPSG